MFIDALKYELSFRRSLVKTEDCSSNNEQSLLEISQEQAHRMNSTLKSYEKNLDDKVLKTEARQEAKMRKISDDLQKDLRQETNDLTTNMLTILGIFVSIIFVIIGSYFTVTSDFVNVYASNSKQVNLGRFVLMAQVLFDVLFLFMFMISRLSGKTVSLKCKNNVKSLCNECLCKCSFFQRIWRKYPYVVLTNLVAMLAYFALTYWWIFEKYISQYIKDFVMVLPKEILVCIFFGAPIITLLIILFAMTVIKIISGCKSKK